MGNKTFTNFVDTYLKDWCGNMEESIFEVNMLSVDEKTILSLNYQKEVHDKLKSANIEPIYTRFRHRNFWDGGLHCLTVDTYREGGCETYL
jgi:glycine amidinotransferase